jgi:hypothetical protein
MLAQEIAGRNLPVAELLLEDLRLRAFARAGSSEQYDVHQRLMKPR